MKAEPIARFAQVESLDQEGRGIAHVEGKAIFITGALPGESVEYAPYRRKPNYELADTTRILRASSSRVTPRCVHFGVCGGCSLQHMDLRAQVAAKQRILEDNLDRIGKIRPQTVLSPILGPDWRYRERARLSARYVEKKARLLLGFHERRSSFVADMGSCEVLPARISRLLEPLKELLNSLCIRERVPQVELAIGDAVDVLVLRILEYPASDDAEKLRKFAEQYQIQFYLQPGGPDTAVAFHPKEAPVLQYRIPDFDLTFPFHPTDFTQVNHAINRVLVRRAITLLDPQAGERIGDFFCGLGNFSLAIARRGAKVFGIDGNARLALRAGETASLNGLGKQCRFVDRDLFKITVDEWKEIAPFDRILLDPPRDGAMELVKVLGEAAPARIVYVSCNPATLARDAGVLVNMHAYQLSAAGVINMFPHTSHVESIAVFDR